LENPKKSFFNNIIHNNLYYLRYLKRKQTVAPLPTTPERSHRTTLRNAELLHLTEGNYKLAH